MKKALLISLVAFTLIFTSCGRGLSCSLLLSRLIAVGVDNGYAYGQIYLAEAQEDSVGYLSAKTTDVLYGGGAFEEYFSLLEDYAIFISQRIPGEIAVFKCYTRSDTQKIAEMCLQRADEIKIALRYGEYTDKAMEIEVYVIKRFVIMSFVEDQRQIKKELKQLL